MADTRAEVWALAQDAGVDDAISRIAAVFGKDAIDGVMVEHDGRIATTRDDLAIERDRVVPGTGAQQRRENGCADLNQYLKENREFSRDPKRRTLHK